jgi:hypothetical protein
VKRWAGVIASRRARQFVRAIKNDELESVREIYFFQNIVRSRDRDDGAQRWCSEAAETPSQAGAGPVPLKNQIGRAVETAMGSNETPSQRSEDPRS